MRSDYNARKRTEIKSKRIMLYVHGGAYFFGSVDEHRYQMQRHARKLKARVLAPRYRLAPQFPFPCGLQDCLASYLFLLSMYKGTEIVLAGDSAGGGMVVSMLCLLRDQNLPMPAGAILISPWVDLTHSFPSVASVNDFDYIPAHGFMHRPSASWPPPNDDEMELIQNGTGKDLLRGRTKLEKAQIEREAAQGFAVRDATPVGETVTEGTTDGLLSPSGARSRAFSNAPGPKRHLQVEIDGKLIELKDQIQMYAPNQLLSHPLVSPVLQPSLGGLPPLLILTGGGEVLRDEQIYLAHKAANPSKYPLGNEYRAKYDPGDVLLKKYKPTFVQLQVWEDLCHVAPTLSFTRPAKYMYRSIAQFGAWALARAQETSIELTDDDNISIISTDSNSSSADSVKKEKLKQQTKGTVGRAGDPIPVFKHHMIRQLVTRHGNLQALPSETDLPALQMDASEVGVIKAGPVKKWMEAKIEWDTKYARIKRKVQKRRIADLVKGDSHSFDGERPPPSALAGRRKEEDILMRKPKKSYGLALWSGWGSKHDEDTIRREEEASRAALGDEKEDQDQKSVANGDEKSRSQSRSRRKSDAKRNESDSRSMSRKRTIAVSDAGQAQGYFPETPAIGVEVSTPNEMEEGERKDISATTTSDGGTESLLTPMFLPKYKTAPHLRNNSKDMSDSASVKTGHSVLTPDNASTRAVFSAAGVSRQATNDAGDTPTSESFYGDVLDAGPGTAEGSIKNDDRRSAMGGTDTPYSRRSVERLMSHQVNVTGADGSSIAGTEMSGAPSSIQLANRLQPLRSPSSMAIAHHEGVVGIVEGGVADENANAEDEITPTQERKDPITQGAKAVDSDEVQVERPGMYDRAASEFKTAMEHL